jgi:hypothetical protein
MEALGNHSSSGQVHRRCHRALNQVEEKEAGLFYAALGYEPETGVRVLSCSLPVIDDQDLPET